MEIKQALAEIFNSLTQLADKHDIGILIEDKDCEGNLYAFTGFELDEARNIVISAHMWKPNKWSQRSKRFREASGETKEFK